VQDSASTVSAAQSNKEGASPVRELSPYLLQNQSPPSVDATPTRMAGPPNEPRRDSSLLDYWRLISDQAWMVAIVTLSFILVVTVIVMTQRPVYTATTSLLIERDNPNVLNIQQIMPDTGEDGLDTEYYKTQYDLLKSRSLAAKVIKEQGLERYPFIASGDNVPSGPAENSAKYSSVGTKQPSAPAKKSIDNVSPNSIDNYLKRLEVEPTRGTRLVEVQFTSPYPELSARIANAHAAAYVLQGIEMRSGTTEEAEHFLESKLAEIGHRLTKSKTALNDYQRTNGIVSINDSKDVVLEKFDKLNTELTEAEDRTILLESQQKLIESHHYDSLPAVLNNELIERLKQQAATVEAKYANLAEEFKPGLPDLDQVAAERDDTNARLRHEIQNVVDGIHSQYLTAVNTENALRDAVDQQKALVLHEKDIGVQYGILEGEVATNQQLYNAVQQRMKETQVDSQVSFSNVFVIDKAEAPHGPSHPKRLKDILLSAVLGLIVGVALAFLRKSIENTLKTPQEVEQLLRLPNLATLPDFAFANMLDRTSLNATSDERLPARLNGSSATTMAAWCAESYRSLRNSLMLSRAGGPPRVLLVTSALNSEGKTMIAANTAACFAKTGMRVLLIDADLRRPRCHELLELDNGVGLSDVLAGHVQLERAVISTTVAGLSILTAGSLPADPAELVGSVKMHQMIMQLRKAYDFIVVDSAPTMLVSDTIPLSAMVDGTVIVVNSKMTPRQAVTDTCSRLNYVGARILGVVLNRVNGSDFLYGNYYYKRYENSYYGNDIDSRP
jgi:succinoglycan biosynthesis transport protein ExoP